MDKSIDYLSNLHKTIDDYIIVACSGGPDSMCLLNLLKRENFKIICAHVNHNIRKESKDELEFLKTYCLNKNIPFEYLELKKNLNQSEAYYRKIRYQFYKNIAQKYNTPYIATAHHGDDLIETILMRISRGSNLKGYAGFTLSYQEEQFIFLKPLIFHTKNEIIEYNKKQKIPFVLDSSNNEDKYTRNRYRHEVLPFLKKEVKDVHEKYLQFSQTLTETNDFINSLVEQQLNLNFNGTSIDLNKFLKLDKFIQKKELEIILKKLYKNDVDKLQVFHINSILFLLEKEKNFSTDLPLGFKAVREYDKLLFTHNEESVKYNLELKDITNLPNGDQIVKLDNSDDTSNYTIFLDSKELSLPLYIRVKESGDKIQIKNMEGSKSVKSIFIDEKIPTSIRTSYPILVDSENKILWIPGLRKSKFDNENREKCDIILRYIKKGD